MRGSPQIIKLEFRDQALEFRLDPDEPYVLIQTYTFREWIGSITDIKTNTRITKDVGKMRRGLFGDWKEAGGIFERRLDYGPGYRVYYARHGRFVIVLLGGGDKGSQRTDLEIARDLWKELKNEIREV